MNWFLRPEASLTSEDFLAEYAERVASRRIRIGCSFAPEQFGAAPDRPEANATALEALRAAVEDVGIADVRLGLRWNHFCPDGETSSGFYARYLEYCFASPQVQAVCLDIGPIKTFRWPEVHVPQAVLASLAEVPERRAVIEAGTELAERSLAHAERTLHYLATEFGDAKPVAFCFNEPFHPFGPLGWTMGVRYLEQVMKFVTTSGRFPDARFVVSSSEGSDLDQIANFFEAQLSRDPALRGRLVSGYNFYPFVPPPVDVPVVGELLVALRRWRQTPRRSMRARRTRTRGYCIEVTEAQCEPWGREQRAGNSVALYQHVLAQCIDCILDPQQKESVIRMWGIEHQLQRASTSAGAENRAILDLTRAINDASRAENRANP